MDEKYDEGHEEGEYHFSDDQSDYETDAAADAPKTASIDDTVKAPGGFARYKRLIIGGAVFVVLMFVIYKMLMPASVPPSTEFNTGAAGKKTATMTGTNTVNTPVSAPAAAPSAPAPVPAATQTIATQTAQTVETPTPPVVQIVQAPVNQPAPPVASSPPPLPLPDATMQPQAMPPSPPPSIAAPEAVAQAEYTQKIANYEAQTNAMHAKVQEMNLRLSSMEASINHLTKALTKVTAQESGEESGQRATVMVAPPPAAKHAEPKMIYTVQAIIPGRAWLKSESGDTVTVAEGDVLRDYGRITKIDPYDGIVEIDTGGKMISLSYGTSD